MGANGLMAGQVSDSWLDSGIARNTGAHLPRKKPARRLWEDRLWA
jgi:hypothetical protein